MQAAGDSDLLMGSPNWFPNSEKAPLHITGEVNPGENWDTISKSSSRRGWARQRLQPVGQKVLYPTAWAPFFLIASAVPLAFPGRTPDDQTVATILFLASWLLLTPIINQKDGLPNRFPSFPSKFHPFDITFIVLGVLVFPLHIFIDSRIGWFSFLFFCIAHYKTIQNIVSAANRNSARWLLPIEVEDYSEDILSKGWRSISKRHKNGPLAIWEGDLPNYTADIVGVTRGEVSFVAFNLKHKSGILHDPFSNCFTENQQFHTLLENPPTKISGEIWPEHYFPNEEE
jgi:hypothetical protein